MSFSEPVVLGKTGLKVGRLGIASGYKAPAAAVEEAFERGCNYFTWGTVIKGYVPGMREALKSIVAKGQRDKLVLAAFTYAHSNLLTERLLARGLRSAGLDHADVLILGYFSRKPPRRLIEGAMLMKKKGLVRFVGLSSHNRKMLGELAGRGSSTSCTSATTPPTAGPRRTSSRSWPGSRRSAPGPWPSPPRAGASCSRPRRCRRARSR